MTEYRYPGRVLAGDYFRALAGLAVGLGVLLSTSPSPAIVAIFGSWTVLFGYFAFKTVQRNVTRVAITDEEIRDVSWRTRVMAWTDLQRLKLRYFGTRRQEKSQGGFMQLKLKGGGRSLTYDSGMEGFDYLAWRAAKAMRENGLAMDPTSAGNLLSLGVDAERDSPPPGRPGSPGSPGN